MLSNEYILSAELVNKMGIEMANISMLRNKFMENEDFSSIVKLGNCTFINTKSESLPNNIRQGIKSNELKSMEKYLPYSYVKHEYKISDADIQKLIDKKIIFENKITYYDKELLELTDSFIEETKNSVLYTLSRKETEECMKDGDIDGYYQISKSKCLTYYKTECYSAISDSGF